MSLILSGTDGLSDVDGSAATPAIRGTDANTGIFFPAADTIAFAEGGSECARFDSSGNFGIGLTSLTQRFQVERSFDGSTWAKISNGNSTSGAAAGVLLSTDQGDAGALSQNSSNVAYGTAANAVRLRNLLNAPITFETNSTERMRINAGAPILCLAGGSTTATGTGIAFPATQSASSDANTLDDYEEGTWTPNDASGAGLSFTSSGTYTKTGRMVLAQCEITFPSTVNGTGALFGGLPFLASVNGGGYCMYNSAAFGFVLRNQTNTTNMIVTNVITPSSAISNASFSGATLQFTFIYNT